MNISELQYMKMPGNDLKFCIEKANDTDAGIDIRCPSDIVLLKNMQVKINLGVAFRIPEGYCGLLFLRSSGSKAPFAIANAVGVIDHLYDDEIKMVVRSWPFSRTMNDGDLPDGVDLTPDGHVKINKGAKIAQLVLVPIPRVESFVENSWKPGLLRGGFGSSDLRKSFFAG